MKVCIFGLGEVGLRLACLCAKKGHEVYGIDIDESKIAAINGGKPYIDEDIVKKYIENLKGRVAVSNVDFIKKSEIILICVPTPVDKNYKPDMKPLQSACAAISGGIKKGHVIIVESSVFPSCVESYLKPILESSGLKAGKDFHLVHCPERIDPGNAHHMTENISRVIGGVTRECAEKGAEFYKTILSSQVLVLDSIKEAEATKLLENIFRDVNIAFVNEMAMLFDKLGIDIKNVIKAASTKPFGFKPFYPGPGVGGDCISVNTYYMMSEAEKVGFDARLLGIVRKTNNFMADYVVELAKNGLREAGILDGTFTILGMTYKKDAAAMSRSPSLMIKNKLIASGINPKIYDPFVKDQSTVSSLEDALKSDCIIIATDHSAFNEIDGERLRSAGVRVAVDARNMLDKDDIKKNGIIYKGIGRR